MSKVSVNESMAVNGEMIAVNGSFNDTFSNIFNPVHVSSQSIQKSES